LGESGSTERAGRAESLKWGIFVLFQGSLVMNRDQFDAERMPGATLAPGTPVRYRPMQPEFFSIRFIGREGRVLDPTGPGKRHCFIEFPCGIVLLVLTSDIEPLPAGAEAQ
jgi:hypothetical protein